MPKGKVYLIGAGPGDPALLTIRAIEAINESDVILYDSLVSKEIIDILPANKNLLCVGKRDPSHIKKQDEINSLLYNLAEKGQIVARLKGGDPFLFGRGGEEALYLMEKGVPLEIIPGISSSLASPIYAGIPITHRDYASSCTIITGHRKGDNKINWSNLAKLEGTLIILMGTENLHKIVKALIENGKDPKSKTAVIRWGTLPYQKTIIGELKEMPKLVSSHNIKPPAVIVIGDAVALREKMLWFEKKPLFGKKILILRPERGDNLSKMLITKGGEVIKFPIISIVPYNDPNLPYVLERINTYDWIVFLSPNGVKLFFEKLNDIRDLYGPKIAVIGEKTKEKVLKFKTSVGLIPKIYTQEALLDVFLKLDIKGKKIVVIKSKRGRDILIKGLVENKALVETLILYDVKTTTKDPSYIKDKLLNGNIDVICFTSPSCVASFLKLIEKGYVKGVKIASIGPITSKALVENGLPPSITAETFTSEGLVSAICKHYGST